MSKLGTPKLVLETLKDLGTCGFLLVRTFRREVQKAKQDSRGSRRRRKEPRQENLGESGCKPCSLPELRNDLLPMTS